MSLDSSTAATILTELIEAVSTMPNKYRFSERDSLRDTTIRFKHITYVEIGFMYGVWRIQARCANLNADLDHEIEDLRDVSNVLKALNSQLALGE